MHLPCKQADVGALPTDSSFSARIENGKWKMAIFTPPFSILHLQSSLFQNCGKLDQCTERSLINFFRWV
jgi:hypothetical protein